MNRASDKDVSATRRDDGQRKSEQGGKEAFHKSPPKRVGESLHRCARRGGGWQRIYNSASCSFSNEFEELLRGQRMVFLEETGHRLEPPPGSVIRATSVPLLLQGVGCLASRSFHAARQKRC